MKYLLYIHRTSDLDTLFCFTSGKEQMKWLSIKCTIGCLHFLRYVFFLHSVNTLTANVILEHETGVGKVYKYWM